MFILARAVVYVCQTCAHFFLGWRSERLSRRLVTYEREIPLFYSRPSEANGIGGGGGWQQWKPRGAWGHAPPDNFKI